jgi:hypothetical protein
MTWPLLFFAYATVCAGSFTFMGAQSRLERARLTDARRETTGESSSALTRTLSQWALLLLTFLLLFYPLPVLPSDLGPSHIAGLCLGAAHTWRSYQLRAWLLQPNFGDSGPIAVAPIRKETVDYQRSAFAGMAKEWKNTAIDAFVTGMLALGLCLFAVKTLIWFGGMTRQASVSLDLGTLVRLIVILSAIASVGRRLRLVEMVGVLRSLPMSGTGSVFFLLSYPCVAALATAPSIALAFYLTGAKDPFGTLATCFILFALGPFAMLLYACWGPRGGAYTLFCGWVGALFCFSFVKTMAESPRHILSFTQWAGVLFMALLILIGLFGFWYLVLNSSTLYRRKPMP